MDSYLIAVHAPGEHGPTWAVAKARHRTGAMGESEALAVERYGEPEYRGYGAYWYVREGGTAPDGGPGPIVASGRL